MTRAQIVAELRRSAREDSEPAFGMEQWAWDALNSYWQPGNRLFSESDTQYRTFVLLVACALEDES